MGSALFKNILYVSNINDIGYWYMNYFYMQVLQGSCVGNIKQLWKLSTIQLHCSKTSRVLIDCCRAVGETNIFINKPAVYKCCCDPKAENEQAIDRSRTQSTVQFSSHYPRFYAVIRHLLNVNNLATMYTIQCGYDQSTRVYHVILGLVFKAHAATMHGGQHTKKDHTQAVTPGLAWRSRVVLFMFVFWIAACAPRDLLCFLSFLPTGK